MCVYLIFTLGWRDGAKPFQATGTRQIQACWVRREAMQPEYSNVEKSKSGETQGKWGG